MDKRVPASVCAREALRELVDGPLGSSAGSAEPITLAAQLTVEEALEVDSRDALDRDCCARGFEPGQCYRDSYRQAPGGGDPHAVPQITGREEPFRSAIGGHLKRARVAVKPFYGDESTGLKLGDQPYAGVCFTLSRPNGEYREIDPPTTPAL